MPLHDIELPHRVFTSERRMNDETVTAPRFKHLPRFHQAINERNHQLIVRIILIINPAAKLVTALRELFKRAVADIQQVNSTILKTRKRSPYRFISQMVNSSWGSSHTQSAKMMGQSNP